MPDGEKVKPGSSFSDLLASCLYVSVSPAQRVVQRRGTPAGGSAPARQTMKILPMSTSFDTPILLESCRSFHEDGGGEIDAAA
jgi:hypothetical protein